MAASSAGAGSEGSQGEVNNQTWDGYSDYQTISSRIGNLIFDAVEAYNDIQSIHVEGAEIRPNQAASARSRIGAAAMVLNAEMSHERGNDRIAEVHDRWNKGRGAANVDVQVPSDGFIEAFQGIRLYDENPRWLGRFVQDFWIAGWELGYLKAGQRERGEPEDPVAADVEAMFS